MPAQPARPGLAPPPEIWYTETEKGGENMNDYFYASICLNGHCSDSCLSVPVAQERYCEHCGEKIITLCPNCRTAIRGRYDYGAENVLDFTDYNPPLYCYSCGKAFPWTQTALDTAKELIESDDKLSLDQRQKLIEILPDTIRETPKTPLATARFQKAFKSVSRFTVDALRQFLIDFGCEYLKKTLNI